MVENNSVDTATELMDNETSSWNMNISYLLRDIIISVIICVLIAISVKSKVNFICFTIENNSY